MLALINHVLFIFCFCVFSHLSTKMTCSGFIFLWTVAYWPGAGPLFLVFLALVFYTYGILYIWPLFIIQDGEGGGLGGRGEGVEGGCLFNQGNKYIYIQDILVLVYFYSYSSLSLLT